MGASSQLRASFALPQYLLNNGVGRPLESSWTIWRIEKYLTPKGIRNLGHPASRSLVTTRITLFRLPRISSCDEIISVLC